jgi:hypothetical protein
MGLMGPMGRMGPMLAPSVKAALPVWMPDCQHALSCESHVLLLLAPGHLSHEEINQRAEGYEDDYEDPD